MSVMVKSTVVNIDTRLVKEHGEQRAIEDIPLVTVHLFGQDFRIHQSLNLWNLLSIGDENDSAAIVRTMINAVHREDVKDFKNALARQADLGAERLLTILGAIVEAASDDHPTQPSSASRRTTPKRTGRALSAAN